MVELAFFSVDLCAFFAPLCVIGFQVCTGNDIVFLLESSAILSPMKKANNYLKHNKESWNKRTDVHIVSDFYNVAEFIKGGTSLNEIELGILGDISGQKVLHLQCHFGQDTLSLARMGAKTTGVGIRVEPGSSSWPGILDVRGYPVKPRGIHSRRSLICS